MGYSRWGHKESDANEQLHFLSYFVPEHGANRGFPDASAVKNLPAMQKTQKTWVQFLGREDPLVEEMAIHPSIFAWKISFSEEPGRLQFKRLPKAGHDWATGNGNPPQYSCLENPMFRGAWWATVQEVAKSWTQLSDWTQTHVTNTSIICHVA